MSVDKEIVAKCEKLIELFRQASETEGLGAPSPKFWDNMAYILNALMVRVSGGHGRRYRTRRERRDAWASRFLYMRDVQQFNFANLDDLADIAMAMADEENSG